MPARVPKALPVARSPLGLARSHFQILSGDPFRFRASRARGHGRVIETGVRGVRCVVAGTMNFRVVGVPPQATTRSRGDFGTHAQCLVISCYAD